MSEEQAQQLMQHIQTLETYFIDLTQQESTFLSILKEAIATVDSIKALGQKPESDTLVPLGMGTYIPARIFSDRKIVLSTRSGVSFEKDLPSAINYLEVRIKEMEVALQETAAKKQEVSARLQQSREQINQLMQSIQSTNSGK